MRSIITALAQFMAASVFAGMISVLQLGAQTAQTSGTSTGPRAPQPPQPERALSPKASAAISAGFKYAPPPPPQPTDNGEVDLRDIDKPQNDIVRLPQYTVTAKKPEVFTDRTLYTQEELRRLAMSRFLSPLDKRLLNRWSLPLVGMSNEDRAMEMYLEQERLDNMASVRDDIRIMRVTDQDERANQTQSDFYDMFLRRRDDAVSPALTRMRGQ